MVAAGDLGNSHRAVQWEGEATSLGPHSKPERLVILTVPTRRVESQNSLLWMGQPWGLYRCEAALS